jgi:cytochrome c oxidase subunit IV
MSDHVVSRTAYVLVFLALLVLTAATTAIAFIDLGPLNDVAMLAIAVLKASLVVLIFMHVRYSGKLTALVVSGGLLWLLIMLGLTLQDYLTRGWLGVPGK